MLLLAAIGLYVVMELLDLARARILHRAAGQADERLRVPLFDAMFRMRAEGRPVNQAQAFSDLRTVREFIPSPPVTAAMDLPAASIFLVLLFVIGPLLGWMALGGVLVPGLLAAVTQRRTVPWLDGGHPGIGRGAELRRRGAAQCTGDRGHGHGPGRAPPLGRAADGLRAPGSRRPPTWAA